MTNNLSLATLAAQIEQAKVHIALAEQIAAAPALLKKLLPEYEKAVAAQAKADADAEEEAEIARVAAENARLDALFAGLSNLRITETVDPKAPGVHRNAYKISYTRLQWLSDFNESVPQETYVLGFDALPPNVFAWIVNRHPDQIPPSIAALGTNADEAFNEYFVARRRGFLKS